jgi:hypothetical protein
MLFHCPLLVLRFRSAPNETDIISEIIHVHLLPVDLTWCDGFSFFNVDFCFCLKLAYAEFDLEFLDGNP